MKILALAFVLFMAGCVVYKPMPAEVAPIGKDISLHGMTREEIYDKAQVWIVRHLYAKENIIQAADRRTGLIVANGFIDYPALGKLQEVEKIQYTISFTMETTIRDQGMMVVFGNLLLDIPKFYRYSRYWPMQEYAGGYSVPITERADYEAARRGLLDIADRLEAYLKQGAGGG